MVPGQPMSVEVADEHDVARLCTSCQGHLIPIGRPVVGNNFVREICDLTGGAAR